MNRELFKLTDQQLAGHTVNEMMRLEDWMNRKQQAGHKAFWDESFLVESYEKLYKEFVCAYTFRGRKRLSKRTIQKFLEGDKAYQDTKELPALACPWPILGFTTPGRRI